MKAHKWNMEPMDCNLTKDCKTTQVWKIDIQIEHNNNLAQQYNISVISCGNPVW
jgi:hypothetical protein